MNQIQSEVKRVIHESIDECFSTWVLTKQEMIEILVSLAGDIAIDKANQQIDPSVCKWCGHANYFHNLGCPHAGTGG